MAVRIKPENTAIRRNKPSRPTRDLREQTLYLPDGYSVLDYGCGRGDDAEWLEGLGYHVVAWDKYIDCDPKPDRRMDVVLCVYVICTIPDPAERIEVIEDAWRYVEPGGCLLLATRTQEELRREAQKHGWPKYKDGWITSERRGTFQKGFTEDELANMCQRLVHLGHVEIGGPPRDYSCVRVVKK
jgi:DNA phosphorothioation-associated putative methyltransferase